MTPITASMVSDIVVHQPGVSYPELQRVLDDGEHNPHGDIEVGPRSDLVFWTGLSHDLWEAMNAAVVSGAIHAHALGRDRAVRAVYGNDGAVLDLPRPDAHPHWVPVVWYPGSGCDAACCLGRTT